MFNLLFVLVVRHLGPGAHDASAETRNGSDRGESGFPRHSLNHLKCQRTSWCTAPVVFVHCNVTFVSQELNQMSSRMYLTFVNTSLF